MTYTVSRYRSNQLVSVSFVFVILLRDTDLAGAGIWSKARNHASPPGVQFG